ncbi:MAG: hypothetical protein RIR70_120, partial [Pseudomonadota bacterium]
MATHSSPAAIAAARVLIVERDEVLREVLGLAFKGMGLSADCVSGFDQARALLTQRAYRLVLTDLDLADGDGLTLTRHVRAHWPGLPVVVLTAQTGLEAVVAVLRAGAVECLAKPVSLDELRAVVRNTLDVVLPSPPLVPVLPPAVLLGESAAIERVRQALAAAARLRVPVSIDGEPGSGKRLVARLIHGESARRDRACVIVDCQTAPTAIEIFGAERQGGHEPERAIEGLLHAAEGGTLVLHHVDQLPIHLQVRLARVLESGRFHRVGAAFDEAADVRVMATSLLPLSRLHTEGRVVDALYYALDRYVIHLPALRELGEDIAHLALQIVSAVGEDIGLPGARLKEDALSRLKDYRFPGNVREL